MLGRIRKYFIQVASIDGLDSISCLGVATYLEG